MEPYEYDAIIVITPTDLKRVRGQLHRVKNNLQVRNLVFISSEGAEEIIRNESLENAVFVNENDIISFSDVEKTLKEIMKTESVPRGIVGWYYQQFLKMGYSLICKDKYYLSWDGDTVPCVPVSMFKKGTKIPYFDLKNEYCEEYFVTMSKLFSGFHKVIKKSFVSEHMLFDSGIMREIIKNLEDNSELKGDRFFDKILFAINPEKIRSMGFSEFETYGTYVALKHPSDYMLKDWHSLRFGAYFFNPDEMSDEDFEWLGKDFDAISFEKGENLIKEYHDIFYNEEYRSKLSARQVYEVVQDEVFDYMNVKEIWE